MTETAGLPIFRSFIQGGFECSCHRFPDGRQLDLLHSTGHGLLPQDDYQALRFHGLLTVRDGIRWHQVARPDGTFDWSGVMPMLHAARDCGMQVIWDLCHYGWPEHVDIWSSDFPTQMARYAREAALLIRDHSPYGSFYCPINEISYWSWAGGDVQHFGPMGVDRGDELKAQLIRASVAAIDAVRSVDANARFVLVDPAVHVHASDAFDVEEALAYNRAQFDAWDALCGRVKPELGGTACHLDIVGVNYYPHNQWRLNTGMMPQEHPDYRPLADILVDVHHRYRRPLLLAETGTEGEHRAAWLSYVCDEVATARARGADIHGICLYPITDYPGWGDDRHCPTGLLGFANEHGQRPLCEPLAEEIARQQHRFKSTVPPPLANPPGTLPARSSETQRGSRQFL